MDRERERQIVIQAREQGKSDEFIKQAILRDRERRAASTPVQQTEQPATGIKGLGVGLLKGVGSTLTGLGQITSKGLSYLPGKVGDFFEGGANYGQELQDTTLKANTTSQKIGKGIEQIAEFLIPSGAVIKGTKAATGLIKGSSLAAKTGRLATRSAIEGATIGTQSAIQQGGINDDVKTAAIVGTLFPVIGASLKVAGKGLGFSFEKAGQKIQQSVIRPSVADVKDGFKVSNLSKYNVGGSLQDTLAKTQVKLNQLSEQLNKKIANSPLALDLNAVVNRAETRLLKDKAASFGDNSGIARTLQSLKNEVSEVAGKNGLVGLTEAQLIKRGAGTKGSWTYGMVDPDSRAVEKVYNTFYNEIKTEIEKVAAKSGQSGIKELNKQISELIPISNAVIRRLPIDQRNNALSLTDSIALFGSLFDVKSLALLGAGRLSKSGKFGNALVKAGQSIKNAKVKSSVGQRVFGN